MKDFSKLKAKGSSEDGDDGQEFPVAYVPHKSGTYYIEIDKAIHSVSQFSSAIQVLDMAGEDDDVVVKLQTPGGSLDATDAFIHALRKCKAEVHMIATGGVHSAGTAILLEAESFELSDSFNSLLHCGSLGEGGTLSEFMAASAFRGEFMAQWLRKVYAGFLSEKEIEDLIAGRDIWLTAEQWCGRYYQRNEYIMAKIEAASKPAKKTRKKKVVDCAE